MYRSLSLSLSLALMGSAAHAAGFQAKTMRDAFSAREVERGLVLGKGWVQIDLGAAFKPATGYWDSEGEAVDFENAQWLYSTQSLTARYGVTRRGELFWKFKTHYVQLRNDLLGTNISQFGLGDPEFGYTFELFRSIAPITSAVVYGSYKAPFANESPGNYVGGPSTFSAVILTTGTPDLTFGTALKKQLGPAAVTVDAAYVYRTSGVVLYALETDYNQFSTRIKPGNIVRIDGEAMVQVSALAIAGGLTYQQRAAIRIGNTSGGLLPSRNLDAIDGSDGWSLDGDAALTFNLTRGVDLKGGVSVPLRGEDLQFFPIEDIHPTRGITYSGTFAFRY